MNDSTIPLILQALHLNTDDVTNIYHHGSWVYGTNSATSDRDLLIVTRSSDKSSLKFWTDFDYFHDFQCHKLWSQYDVTVYTVEHFEILLEKNYLIAVQCVFLPEEFKLKDEIDFRKIYLDKYYNAIGIKRAASYEMYRDWKLYKPENDHAVNSILDEKRLSRRDYVFKHLFHGLRYLDFADQLIQTRSIHNYQRATCIFNQMKHIRGDALEISGMQRVAEFVHSKSIELRAKLDALVPTNIIKGSFEVFITFDCTQNTEQIIADLRKVCVETRYQLLFVQSAIDQDQNNSQQILVSSQYHGEYPSIVKQIEYEANQYFHGVNMRGMKIKSMTSNEGIPKTCIDKKLFWNRTNYFAFDYNVPLEKDRRGEKLRKLINTCRSKYGFNPDNFHLLRHEFKQIDDQTIHYVNVLRLFNVGREKAFVINDEIIESSRRTNLPVTVMKDAFIVYDRDCDK